MNNRIYTAPLFLLSLLLVGLLALATIALVRSFDFKSMQREEELVGNGIASRIEEVGRIVIPQVVWADAVRNLDNRFDREWAKINVLNFLDETGGFDTAFVLDSQNRLLIAGEAGVETGPPHYARFEGQLTPLILAVRQAEAAREAGPKPADGLIKTPIQSNALISVDGQTFIMTASRVQPDFHDNHLRGFNGPIVLAGMRLDQNFLGQFGQRFLLRGLTVVATGTATSQPSANIPLVDAHGATIAQLRWHPQRPGADLFSKLAPSMVVIALLLLALALFLFHRSRHMAQGLITSEARAAHLAYHDSLTGLPNRVQFGDRLAHALALRRRGGEAVTVLCIDLDRFKDINDTYGHAVGDALLKEAARRMNALCRSSDVLARLSGDEFAVIKQGGSAAEASALAARLCREIASPFALGAAQLHIGCSVGITIASAGECEPAELLREADIALYKAKEEGKGRFCYFEQELDIAIKGRRLLEAELRKALHTDQLSLAYQPQVTADGTTVGLEALLRWTHPERGEIAPTQFVPVAEQSGLIVELGHFAIRRAFIDSHRWPHLRIAINISAVQIRDPLFLDWLARTVQTLKIDPARFDFEITEGILLGDDPETQERLAGLSKLGFGLALDDFGTGYSSLSYLHRYPIDKIKIDRSFIANLGIEDQADAVVDAIIKLARALSLGVVAEGVETRDQLRRLKSAGCTELQGFLFCRPVPADVIDRMVAEQIAA